MYEKRNELPDHVTSVRHPLRSLTAAEFAALGGSAVAYVRAISGEALGEMIEDAEFNAEETYQLVMSADGTPLLVTDSREAVAEWFGDKNMGVVSLH